MRLKLFLGILSAVFVSFYAFGQETKALERTYETGIRTGQVLDAVTNQAISGAIVIYMWCSEENGLDPSTGVGYYETFTDKNGNYFIPNQKLIVTGELSLEKAERVFIYKKGYLWYLVDNNRPHYFREHKLNLIYQKENNIAKLKSWDEKLSHSEHIKILRNKAVFPYRSLKLEQAFNDEWEMAEEEKAAKTGDKDKTPIYYNRMVQDNRAFKDGTLDKAEYIRRLNVYLDYDSVEVKSFAAVRLFEIREDYGIEPLIKCLKDNLQNSKFNRALGGLRVITDRQDLEDTEEIERRQEIINEIEKWWKENKGKESLWLTNKEREKARGFEKLLSDNVSDSEKFGILNEIQTEQDKSAAPYLFKLLNIKNQNKTIYEAATHVLFELGEKPPIEPLKPLLYQGSIYVRSDAAVNLNKLGDRSGIAIMILSLESKSRNSRSVANAALKEMTGQDFANKKSLRDLSDAEERKVLNQWKNWWNQNRYEVEIDRRKIAKAIEGEDEALKSIYTAMEEKEKNNSELPKFEDEAKSPKATFEKFRTALLRRDIKTAVSLMSFMKRDEYEKAFKEMGIHLEDYARNLGKIYFDSELGNMLSYEMLTEMDEGMVSFPVHFVQDEKGEWLILEL